MGKSEAQGVGNLGHSGLHIGQDHEQVVADWQGRKVAFSKGTTQVQTAALALDHGRTKKQTKGNQIP